MNNFQKLGGIAALLHSAAYIVGIGLYFAVLSPIIDADPGQYLILLKDYQTILNIWILSAYIVAGFCLVFVSLALYHRMKLDLPELIQAATVFGLIWAGLIIASGNLMLFDFSEVADLFVKDPAQAKTVWTTLKIVEDGIVSGNELIGGVWVLMISWFALRTKRLPKALNFFGMLIGFSGIVSVIPAIAFGAVIFFGFSMIVWFAWLGIVMLRSNSTS